MALASPFHPQELAAQERVGVRQQLEAVGRNNVRDHMPEQHRRFFAQLPFFFLGANDASGQPWATVLSGSPGFLQTPDSTTLQVNATVAAGDALAGQLTRGKYIGALGLEPATRRRNRVNGVIEGASTGGFSVAVKQSFGNCPQYIQSRQHHEYPRHAGGASQVIIADQLNDADRALLASADTFFIATSNLQADAGNGRGVDLSHRGGRPGFVHVDDAGTVTVPDFIGNFYFNTIGNLLAEPAAGLLFIDFDSGDTLQLAVTAEVIWDGPELRAFAGAERLLRFKVRKVHRNVAALPWCWSPPQQSPVLAGTGTWEAAQQILQQHRHQGWRRFRVSAVKDESATIRSFTLKATDGLGLAPFEPGQFLPIRISLPGRDAPVVRTYTLSDASYAPHYRISVKRDGLVSSWLHDHVQVGDQLEAMQPAGDFVFDATSQRPLVLLSAGVGVTPMMAILNSLLVNEGRTRHLHPIYFIHAARHPREQAFAEHVKALAARHRNLHAHVRYSAVDQLQVSDLGEGDVVRYQRSAGRLEFDFLRTVLPFDDYDFYLCGPASFMQDLYDGLRKLNIAPERIRFEAFGLATVKTLAAPAALGAVPIPVNFVRSGVTAQWDGGHQSLLELAEAAGLPAASGCRAGGCGACSVRLVAGEVAYTRNCSVQAAPGEVLLCSTQPQVMDSASMSAGIVLDL
ncbi:hypothetical protein FHW67_002361 [Herbaspirillum sp. Sphag1AN]|uniref:2Fe-2S iron-sulfur cluster-binding protein n=1 Tax=unclassified Herbaspirillum TaxID=2624150 RepID=UPI001612BFE5|nr:MULTISPECIES: pyridoxamine 5'-phosphate oxidase family protein [unclassified Herbaspirillum]MBB3213072.1 hypothetical protein [Herbaspirillum sp. Sphag1AN]MBB3246269.1 hypothetical protein [Herbaspirillum sp. Sphag64]